jgi:hypothetical protein
MYPLKRLAPIPALAALTVATFAPRPAGATIIWAGTPSSGSASCTNGTVGPFDDPTYGNVYRFTIAETTSGTSERCEIAVARRDLQVGMTVYAGWRSRVQTPIHGSWNGIYQAKCHGAHVADQPLVISVKNGTLTVENHEDIGGNEVSRDVWRRPLPMNTWFSMMLKIHYSESRSTGYVQVWYNGVLQTLLNGTTIHHGQTWDGSENNMHWGIYRADEINGTEIHYLSRPVIATTQAEADPGGGGTNPTPTPSPTPTPVFTPTPTPTNVPTATPSPTPCAGCSFVEVTPGAGGVTASTNDGNLPGNTVDNNLSTRWSGNGDGAWIQYDLGTVRTISHVSIAVYNGNTRQNRFDLQLSDNGSTWTNVFTNRLTSGGTTGEEVHDFADADARYIRYVGHGSTAGTFNSVTELSVFTLGTAVPTATPTPPATSIEVTPGPSGVSASTQDTNVAGNAVDNNLATRWSGNGDGAWIRFDLGSTRTVTHVTIAVHQGDARRNRFDLQLSADGTTWSNVVTNKLTSGTSLSEETHDFADSAARYVRYVGHGATLNAGGTSTWNSVSEVSLFAAP